MAPHSLRDIAAPRDYLMIRIRDLSRVQIERVEFPSAGGVVRGLWYSGGPSETCVVMAHGYSSSKHNVDPLAFYLATEGVTSLALDFQGHKLGASSLPLRSPEDLRTNVRDACNRAREIPNVRKIVACGHSMGAAAAVGAAVTRTDIDGVVVMCTALGRSKALDGPSILGGLRNRACYVDGPTPEEITKTMDNYTQRIAEIAPRPLLVIAGSKDSIVAPSLVRALFDTAGEPKTFELIEATHTDCAERAKFVVLRWLRARGFSPPRSNA
jgi:alpha-beta hydrolase superfamily lysophospholipase